MLITEKVLIKMNGKHISKYREKVYVCDVNEIIEVNNIDNIIKIIQKLIIFLININKAKILIDISDETEKKITNVIGKLKNYLSDDRWLKDKDFRSSMKPEDFSKIREDWKTMVNQVEQIKDELTESISFEFRN